MKCSKCGYENIEGADFCDLCKKVFCKVRNAEIVDILLLDKHHEKLLIDARAILFWGRPVSEVEALLSHGGIAQDKIDKLLKLFAKEYAAVIRRESIRDIGIGVVSLLICWKMLEVIVHRLWWRASGIIILGCGTGVFLIMRGFEKIIWSFILTRKKKLSRFLL